MSTKVNSVPEIHIPQKPVADKATFDLLATVIQRTFGKQSSLARHHYLSFKLLDDKHVSATFVTICTVNQKHPMHPLMKSHREEALGFIKDEIKKISEEYKAERAKRVNEESKKTVSLSVNNESIHEELEYTQTTIHAHIKKAYYKLNLRLEID